MNIRKVYLGLVAVLSVALFYEWTSDNKSSSISKHLELAGIEMAKPKVSEDGAYVYLENDLLRLKISIQTGSVLESRLKQYGVENVEGSMGVRVFGSSDIGSFKYYLRTGFTGQAVKYVLDSYGDNFVLLKSGDGSFAKEFSFLPNTYEVLIKDSSSVGVEGKAFASLYRTEGRSLDLKTGFIEGGMMNNSSYQGVAISSDQDPYETTRLRALDKPTSVLSRSGWISFIQKYFFAALIGSNEYVYNYFTSPAESGVYRMGYTVEKGEATNLVYSHSHRVFIGPKIRKDLAERAENLELSIDMGWFWFISQPMVWFLDLINEYVNSWALSIIIFTLILKLALFPITAKGFVSMAGMRKVGPMMKDIQDRYKNDRQKASAEVMALYKREKVNPLGGCLPVLAQMPFFIGFFFALREMVELRHASFFWISDLSIPDPLFILPVLFGLVMVSTQRLSPAPPTSDPTQAQVMKYMPVIFSIFFVIFPAGLCLYSVINSGVSLAQQRYLYKKTGVLSPTSAGGE
ncbi:MAG: membrane protein insertase YidC [Proteobacteria bacterium]|jgi:YidC/Oxa1 family membrane protein insertase|nr:membrane protein insertase YidC [Pseudomonadota bacterium]MDA1082891.1 membrane protein insertase YidC [Pseudomonadota bacterium]